MNLISQKINIIKTFGPTIAKTTIPEELIKNLNEYFDNVSENFEKNQKLNVGQNLVGMVKNEVLIEPEFAKKSGWGKFLASVTSAYVSSIYKKKITKFNIIQTWIVSQFENEYNPTHTHAGHLSGVGYLKIPSSFGPTVQKNKKSNLNGALELIHGSKQFACESTHTVIPSVGEFYLFPNYLMHAVYPFNNTSEERRSVSFNALIDEEIYNEII
jgi:hypothetical protein